MAVSFFIMFIARLKYYFAWIIGKITNVLTPVVERLDSAIHWINHYLADKYWENRLHYPLDYGFIHWIAFTYPPFELLGFSWLMVTTCFSLYLKSASILKLLANGRNNSPQCWTNDVETCSASWEGYNRYWLWRPCVISMRVPSNVGRAVRTDPTS